jgi:hypothetical protein
MARSFRLVGSSPASLRIVSSSEHPGDEQDQQKRADPVARRRVAACEYECWHHEHLRNVCSMSARYPTSSRACSQPGDLRRRRRQEDWRLYYPL